VIGQFSFTLTGFGAKKPPPIAKKPWSHNATPANSGVAVEGDATADPLT
jgi:hypothetical protein